MPLAKYYRGHGQEVMDDMKERYGERAESVFYATANKKGMTPSKGDGTKKRSVLTKKGSK